MKFNTRRYDPDLARFCRDLADTAAVCADATHALLINANRVRLNLHMPRGGTVLLLRFPATMVVDRDAPAIAELLAGRQPHQAVTIHPNAETETGDWGLGTGDRGLGTGDQGPGAGNQGLGTGDQGPGTGSQDPDTGDQEPESTDRGSQPGSDDRRNGAGQPPADAPRNGRGRQP